MIVVFQFQCVLLGQEKCLFNTFIKTTDSAFNRILFECAGGEGVSFTIAPPPPSVLNKNLYTTYFIQFWGKRGVRVQHQVAYAIDLGQKVCQSKNCAHLGIKYSLNVLHLCLVTLFSRKKGWKKRHFYQKVVLHYNVTRMGCCLAKKL